MLALLTRCVLSASGTLGLLLMLKGGWLALPGGRGVSAAVRKAGDIEKGGRWRGGAGGGV